MRCASCGRDNPTGNRFCSFCGSALVPAAAPLSSESPGAGVMAFLRSVHDGNGAKAAAVVFIVCAAISLIGWYPLSLPVRLIRTLLPDVSCTGTTPGTFGMYLCSAGVGLMVIAAPVLLMVVIFLLRKPLTERVERLTQKLPKETRFLVAPALATIIFVIAWSGVHKDTASQWGMLPQIIFPAVIGLFTFAVARFGPSVQGTLGSFFDSRDRLPRWIRLLAVIAVPMLLALLITYQERVTQEALKEQFIVLVALVMVYLMMSPRVGALASGGPPGDTGAASKAMSGGSITPQPSPRSKNDALRSIWLSVGMAVSLAVLLDLLLDPHLMSTALAHDCSDEADCVQTPGYNATTATGGGVIGATAGGLGGSLAGTAGVAPGATVPSQQGLPDMNGDSPNLQGGPGDNPYTSFDGGRGPGIC